MEEFNSVKEGVMDPAPDVLLFTIPSEVMLELLLTLSSEAVDTRRPYLGSWTGAATCLVGMVGAEKAPVS